MDKKLLIGILAILFLIAGCTTDLNVDNQADNDDVSADKIKVSTLFFPVEEIVREIGGDKVEISAMVPVGADPHGYEPTPRQIVEISDSDVFFTIGGMFEELEEDILSSSDVTSFNSIDDIYLLYGEGYSHDHDHDHDHDHGDEHHEDEHYEDEHHEDEHHEDEHHEDEHHEDEHYEDEHYEDEHHEDEHHEDEHHEDEHHEDEHHEDEHHEDEHHEDEHHEDEHHEDEHHDHSHDDLGYDPHYWLSIDNMVEMTENVLEGLIEVSPENEEVFRANANEYIEKLEALEERFDTSLDNCVNDKIIVSHKAFGYLAEEYDFEQVSVAGFSPESEPTPNTLREVIDTAKEYNLKYVFSEKQLDSKVSDTIANDIGGEVLIIHSVKTDEAQSYISMMEENLESLKKGLSCN